MLKLASMLYSIVGTTLAGSLIVVGLAAPSLGLDDGRGIIILAAIGFIAALPVSWWVAREITRRTRRP